MAGIANIGSFASGLMRGHLTATEEQRREEDQAFQKQQRDAWQEEQDRQKRVRAGIAGIARPGTETGRTQFMMEGIDGPEALPGAYTVNRQTDEGFLRGLADLYYKEGMPEQAFGAEERGFTLKERARTLGQRERIDAALARRRELHKKAKADPVGFMVEYGQGEFNADKIGGPRFAGHTVAMASTPNGQVGYMINPQGQTVGSIPITSEAISRFIDSLTDDELSAASPEMYSQVAGRGLQRGQLSAQQMTAQAAMRNAQANEDYRRWLQDRPTLMSTGSGKVVAIDSTGTRQLGMFGERRPVPGSAMAELRDPRAYAAAVDRYNALAEQFATETNPAKRADLIARMNVVEIQMSNAAGRPAQIRGTNAPRPDITFKDFVAAFAGSPSGQVDRKTGKPVLFGDLPPEQQLAAYQRVMGGGGGAQGGLPDAPPPTGGLNRPIIVRPNEQSLVPEGARTMGDPRNFLRESKRGLFGGVNYSYRDPVTNKTYSIDEYNRLLGE